MADYRILRELMIKSTTPNKTSARTPIAKKRALEENTLWKKPVSTVGVGSASVSGAFRRAKGAVELGCGVVAGRVNSGVSVP